MATTTASTAAPRRTGATTVRRSRSRSRSHTPSLTDATDITVQREVAERFHKGQVSDSDRDDLAQHLRLALLEAMPRYRRSQGAWSTFVRAVVHGSVSDWLRQRLRQCRNEHRTLSMFVGDGQALASWAADIPDTSQPETQERVDQREAVRALIDHLDEDDREIAELLMRHTPSAVSRLLERDRPSVYEAMRRIRETYAALEAAC